MLPSHTIKTYRPEFRDQVEEFREQTFKEGNQSLARDKFDPDNFRGQVWVIFVDDKLVSLSACEASHYTSDPFISARVVRLHTLKAYRPTAFGMLFLPPQIEWCKQQGYKIMWWSIDIRKRGLNNIYQRKHSSVYRPHKEAYDGWWQNLVFDKSMLFMVDPRADLLQYVYYFVLEDSYKWKPKSNMVYVDHDGDIKQEQVSGLIKDSRRWRPTSS